ncbi:MAG TPA: hypothetical protein VGH03_05610, partial [Caulobacteraceae bacterium]
MGVAQAGRAVNTAPFAEFEGLRRRAGGGQIPSVSIPKLHQRASHFGVALFLWLRPTPRRTPMTKRPLKRLVREGAFDDREFQDDSKIRR